jgi:two-component system phosphate regulon response regulator PhoB
MIADDESEIAQALAMSLTRVGHRVLVVPGSAGAEAAVRSAVPDLVLLDWPAGDGGSLSLLRRWRMQPTTRELLIIMLTRRTEERDKIAGLNAGADDYVTKPFGVHELQARIRAVFRRWNGHDGPVSLQVGPLRLDPGTRRLYAHGELVVVGATDFRLLESLMRGAGRVQSRTNLVDQVWGHATAIETRTIDVHIKRLRDALSTAGCAGMIQTWRGFGYSVGEQVSAPRRARARRSTRTAELPAAA